MKNLIFIFLALFSISLFSCRKELPLNLNAHCMVSGNVLKGDFYFNFGEVGRFNTLRKSCYGLTDTVNDSIIAVTDYLSTDKIIYYFFCNEVYVGSGIKYECFGYDTLPSSIYHYVIQSDAILAGHVLNYNSKTKTYQFIDAQGNAVMMLNDVPDILTNLVCERKVLIPLCQFLEINPRL
jgi:hypothetical protein